MGRGGESFEKRRLQKLRQERKAAKRDRRVSRKEDDPTQLASTDETELMERFRLLSERHAAGAIDEADYERERHEIFVALGLEEDEGGGADSADAADAPG